MYVITGITCNLTKLHVDQIIITPLEIIQLSDVDFKEDDPARIRGKNKYHSEIQPRKFQLYNFGIKLKIV